VNAHEWFSASDLWVIVHSQVRLPYVRERGGVPLQRVIVALRARAAMKSAAVPGASAGPVQR